MMDGKMGRVRRRSRKRMMRRRMMNRMRRMMRIRMRRRRRRWMRWMMEKHVFWRISMSFDWFRRSQSFVNVRSDYMGAQESQKIRITKNGIQKLQKIIEFYIEVFVVRAIGVWHHMSPFPLTDFRLFRGYRGIESTIWVCCKLWFGSRNYNFEKFLNDIRASAPKNNWRMENCFTPKIENMEPKDAFGCRSVPSSPSEVRSPMLLRPVGVWVGRWVMVYYWY